MQVLGCGGEFGGEELGELCCKGQGNATVHAGVGTNAVGQGGGGGAMRRSPERNVK